MPSVKDCNRKNQECVIFFLAMTYPQFIEKLEALFLVHLHKDLEKIMSDLSRLNAAVAKLTTDVDTFLASQTNDQPAIDAATTVVETADAKIVAATPAPPTT